MLHSVVRIVIVRPLQVAIAIDILRLLCVRIWQQSYCLAVGTSDTPLFFGCQSQLLYLIQHEILELADLLFQLVLPRRHGIDRLQYFLLLLVNKIQTVTSFPFFPRVVFDLIVVGIIIIKGATVAVRRRRCCLSGR